MNNPLAGTDPTGYCAAETGTHIKTCVDVKVTMTDGSSQKFSVNTRSAGDMARAFNTSIPGLKGGDNGSRSAQGATGAGSRQEQAASVASKGGSLSNLANPSVTGSEVGRGGKPDADDYAALAIAANGVIGDPMYSNPGESRSGFDWRVRDQIAGLTDGTGYEYRSTFSSRTDPESQQSMQYAAVIQTSGSPFVSVGTKGIQGDGWTYDPTGDEHSHGFLKTGYRYTALDVAYLRRESGTSRQVGERANLSDRGGSRTAFSDADKRNGFSMLVTPTGLLRGSRAANGKWVDERLKRPEEQK